MNWSKKFGFCLVSIRVSRDYNRAVKCRTFDEPDSLLRSRLSLLVSRFSVWSLAMGSATQPQETGYHRVRRYAASLGKVSEQKSV